MRSLDAFAAGAEAGSVATAVTWVQAALTGTIAASIAVIAIAAVGVGMMSGRIDIRRAAITVMGCFVVFGAPSIAAGILAAVNPGANDVPDIASVVTEGPKRLPRITSQPDYDPYAGAAMPTH